MEDLHVEEKKTIQGAAIVPLIPKGGESQPISKVVYFSLMFLNASVLWAYYSVLAAQSYYQEKFKGFNFEYYITFVVSWPMIGGHIFQVVFGLDKKLGFNSRITVGYITIIGCAILIMVQDALPIDVGGHVAIILLCVGIIGMTNSITESPLYGLAGLFHEPSYTQAMQSGNGMSAVVNIVVLTIIRLAVGGVNQSGPDSGSLSFFLFFGVLITVALVALADYHWLVRTPMVRERMQANAAHTTENALDKMPPRERIRKLLHISNIIRVPAAAQFFVFFVSLTLFPGIPCDAKLTSTFATFPFWFCSPTIIGGYALGDQTGRVVSVGPIMRKLSVRMCAVLAVARVVFIPLILFGVSPILVTTNEWLMALWVFLLGLSNGILSTVTMAKGPLMVPEADRESAAYVMVTCLYSGIAAGSTLGFIIGHYGMHE